MELTRKEIKGQKAELIASNRHREQQNFESAFFQLLNLLQKTVSDMDVRLLSNNTQKESGKDSFELIVRQYNIFMRGQTNLDERYRNLHASYRGDLGHYLRLIYNVINYIHTSKISNKIFYAKIFESQLSDYEIIVIFLYNNSDSSTKEFNKLITKYDIVKSMDETLIEDFAKLEKEIKNMEAIKK